MFKEDFEANLEGDSKGDFRGDFKQDMEGGLAVKLRSGKVQVRSEWPQNDSQMTPTVLYSCGHYYCSLFGAIQVIFKFAFQGKFLPYDRIVREIL